MDTQNQAKSNAKRRFEGAKCEHRKVQRLTSPVELEHTTKIIDLNDDCLVKMFGYLDLQSLFNVAIANEYLRPAAREVYKWKFGKKEVDIIDCAKIRRNTRANARLKYFTPKNQQDGTIRIRDFKTSLQYLRCFGPSISELCINYINSKSKRYGYIHQYINDYCADCLTCITFWKMPNIAIEQFQNVFANVKDVDFYGCCLGAQWSTFVKCFPNVDTLYLDESDIVHRCVENPFQNLKSVFIKWCCCNGFTTNQFVADLVHDIHQLECLDITKIDDDEPKIPINTVLTMTNVNPSITKLVYEFYKRNLIPVNAAEVQRIITEYPALIELKLKDYRFTADDVIALARQLNSLKTFKFQMLKSEYAGLMSQLRCEWRAIENYFDVPDDVAFDNNLTSVALIRKI